QTPGYATALLTSIAAFRGTTDDISEAVEACMHRNSMIHESDHRLTILVEEPVLRYRIGDTHTMAAQLGHLLSAMALLSISLVVIPFIVERTVWPMATLTVFDDQRVHADSLDTHPAGAD
ncbi:Scr1 family TA system antitoxin-like transcriptional regulator, partial [Streptomyces mirabilis]